MRSLVAALLSPPPLVRLRRLLAEERRSLRVARENLATELRARTEVNLLLRRCIADARRDAELAERRGEGVAGGSRPGSRAAGRDANKGGTATSTSVLLLNESARRAWVEDIRQREDLLQLLAKQAGSGTTY
jgi:hypothetical protein